MVPKKDDEGHQVGWRKIMHLSYPRTGSFGSVNSNIDPEDTHVRYQTFDQAVSLCMKLGSGGFLAKSDLKSAFRQLPIHKEDLNLLGFRIDSLWFIDKCMPFRLAIACKVFEKFSSVIHWRVAKLIAESLLHYLDDFLLGGRNKEHCQRNLEVFQNTCQSLRVPISWEKTTPPKQKLSFLGLGFDMVKQTVGIPENKVLKALRQIEHLLNKKMMQVKNLQKLAGLLNFIGKAVPGARAFTRHLYDAMRIQGRKPSPFLHVKVSDEVKADLRVWKQLLVKCNYTVPFYFVVLDQMQDSLLFTDASQEGWGMFFQNYYWAFGKWSKQLTSEDYSIGRTPLIVD